MIQGELLYELQQLDLELENGQRRIAEIKEELGETKALQQARSEVTAAEKESRQWFTRVRDLELEIEALNTKSSATEKRLYSGRVTNPKELTDMQEEIASLKRRRSDLEDELLEAMVYGEEAGERLNHRRTTLNEMESEWQARQDALIEELSQLEERMTTVQDEREQLRPAIPAENLTQYDKIRSRFGSPAVATLRNGVCGFCAVAPSSTKLKSIRSGRELLLCGNCGRILLDL
jgi:predicted  nucleic acid-binding Zn-ribbon protein